MTTETEPVQVDAEEGDVPGVADSLQNLVSEISTRVNLADPRYSDIIGEMREKLTALDALARASREKAEEQARREVEAQAKAQAEAEAEAKRRSEEETERLAEAERQAAAKAEAEAEAQRQEEAARKKVEADAAEAVDAAKAVAAAAVAKSLPIYADDIDPFDIVDHIPSRHREPWDRESADVFTRDFEQFTRLDAVPPTRPHIAGQEPGPPAIDRDSDRRWLEGRFNDIATRISEMMSGQPANLDARFDTLENRISEAMAAVTTHATTGSDTLKQIEGHVAEIEEHVDFIRGELKRLDGMEAQIRAVMETQKGVADQPEAVATANGEPTEATGVAQLSGLLQRLMAERRNTEEHTISMLDTLQQAMIRVLDRIETMEAAHPQAMRAVAPASEASDEPATEMEPRHIGERAPADTMLASAPVNSPVMHGHGNLFADFDEELGRRSDEETTETSQPSREELQASIQQIRRNFVIDAQRARDRVRGEGRRAPVVDGLGSQPSRSLMDRLLRPSTKQLAVAAIGLLLPLNVLFLYLVMASPNADPNAGMRSAAEQAALEPERLTEANRVETGEPVASPPEMLTRINAPLPPEPAPAAEPAETASAPVGGKVEMPPATIGPLTLRRAAADGDASAQFEVAARLAEGKGIDQDFKAAVQWYLRSASSGFAQAQYRLGTHYERGLGVERDPERAKVWYQQAAKQGNVKAMHNLAVICAGKQEYAEAIKWFTDASAYNLPDSQFNLAVLLEGGMSGTKDPKLAYVQFALAARGGDKEAMKRRDLVKAQLSSDAVTAADEEVRSFRTKPQIPVVNDARVAGELWKKQAASN